MWLTAADQKRNYLTRGSKSLNSKYSGSPKHLLSKGLEEPVELGRVIATGCTQLPYTQNYHSTAILKS